ncbi:MAG: hypothetical protein ACLQBD_05550 [Syntrophobacteraceae bacterium]
MTSLLVMVRYSVRDEDFFQTPGISKGPAGKSPLLYSSMAAAGSADNLSYGRLDYKIVSMLIAAGWLKDPKGFLCRRLLNCGTAGHQAAGSPGGA